MRTMHGLAILSTVMVFSCGGHSSIDAVTGDSGGSSGSVDTSGGSGGDSVAEGGASVAKGGASVAEGGDSMSSAGASMSSGGTSGDASSSAGAAVVLDISGANGGNGSGHCAWVLTRPPSPLISDFPVGMAPASNFLGEDFPWGVETPGSATVVDTVVAPGEMHAQSTGVGAEAFAYLVPIPPELPATLELCFDLSKYFTGFKFKIRSPTNKSLVFDVLTPQTESLGRCKKQITVGLVNAEITVAFSDLVLPKGVDPKTGMVLPVGYNPGAHVEGIGFLATNEEQLDIYVDDITFY